MAPRPLTDDHTLISPSNPSNNTSNPSNPNNNDNGNIANKNNSSSSYSGASKNPVKAAFKIGTISFSSILSLKIFSFNYILLLF